MDAAIHPSGHVAAAVADRLVRECRAAVVDVVERPQDLTIRLTIPQRGLGPLQRVRRDLWMTFVSSNVRDRRLYTEDLRLRVAEQREAIGRSRELTERNRARLRQRTRA